MERLGRRGLVYRCIVVLLVEHYADLLIAIPILRNAICRASCQSYNPKSKTIQLSSSPDPSPVSPTSDARHVHVRPKDVLVPVIVSL
jgi:hypothetical protein